MKFSIDLLKSINSYGQEICAFSNKGIKLLEYYSANYFSKFSTRSYYFWKKGERPIPLSVLTSIMEEKNIKEIEIFWFSVKGGNKLIFSSENSIEFSYFLGLLLGDGCLIHTKKKDGRNTCLIQISFRKKEEAERIKPLCENFFNIVPSIYEGRGCFNLCVFSKPLVFILNKKYEIPIGEKYSSLKIPEIILRGFKKNKIAFLKGVFDSDGNIYFHRGRQSVQLRQKSKSFLLELFNLFKEVGVEFNNPYYDKANDSWVLWSSKKGLVDTFIKKISNFSFEALVAQSG
jgi:intein/homing endonuclease